MALAISFKIQSAYCVLPLFFVNQYNCEKLGVLAEIYHYIFLFETSSQYTDRILDKIPKAINKTFAGLKFIHQGFRI